MKTSDFVILAAIGFYLIGMLFVGFYYSHKNNSSDDDPRENIPERTGKGHIEDDED